MLTCIYATDGSGGTFLLFKVVWANHFPNDEVKDDCLKLDWFSREADKPENLSSHSKSSLALQWPHRIDTRIPA